MPSDGVLLLYALFAANGLSFLLFVYDKLASKTGKVSLRVSERALLFFAFTGGIGAFCAMFSFRHKTRHKKFRVLVPLFLVLNICALLFIFLIVVK